MAIAGLCHDLGHGPFSHMFEMFLHNISEHNQRVSEWSHEEASTMLFNDMLDKYSHKIIIKK